MLREAFSLHVPKENKIKRIMSDEHHLVAMSQLAVREPESPRWFMSVFDLQAISDADVRVAGQAAAACKFFLAERHVRLDMESARTPVVFLLDGWLVFRLENELAWIDKEGKRTETSTEWNSKKWLGIYASGSTLILTRHDGKILLKR